MEPSISIEKDQSGKYTLSFDPGCSAIDCPLSKINLTDKYNVLEAIITNHNFFKNSMGNVIIKSTTLSTQEQQFFYPLIEGYNSLASEIRAALFKYD